MADQLSLENLVNLGERLARDAAVLLDRAAFDGAQIASAAVEADLGFASEAERAAFLDEYLAAIGPLVKKYGARGGMPYRVAVAVYPDPTKEQLMDQVEHTFVVAVPVERAWSAFTDGHERSQWEAPEYEIDAQPGGKLHWRIPPWPTVEGEVLEVDPNRRLVMSEGEGILDGATRITVTFESVDDGTRITVVQAGFGDGARWQDELEGHHYGWERAIRDLVLYLETGLSSRRFFTAWHCDLGMCTIETLPGVRVTEVLPDGFAADAGVTPGDVLLYIDGAPIFQRTDLWPFQIVTRTRREPRASSTRATDASCAAPARCEPSPRADQSGRRAVRLGVLPVGQQRAERGQQHQRLIEHRVVARLRQLDHRRNSPERLVHRVADVGRDEALLRSQQCEPAPNRREVGQGDAAHPSGELLEDAAIELPLPAAVDGMQRPPGDVIDDVVEVVRLRRHGAKPRRALRRPTRRCADCRRLASTDRTRPPGPAP